MTNLTSSLTIEQKLTQANRMQPRPEFLASLQVLLTNQSAKKASWTERIKMFLRQPVWVVTFALLLLLVIGTLVIGPQRVYAEFARLFGYIPGSGIVDQSAPIRVLAEPVSLTRDGITVTVTSATLSADKTQIKYRVFGIPSSAYPDREDIVGCMQPEYLRLPDGTRLVQVNFGYQPVPANVNETVFVIPCLQDTLPGKAPENWEIQLHFVPAPADMTVMPVIELTPLVQSSQTQSSPTGTAPVEAVTVNTEVETSDGYILIGQFMPQTLPGESFQQTGMLAIMDAAGKNLSYTFPQDVNENVNSDSAGGAGAGWAAQFKAAGLAYPLTIRFKGILLEQADPKASVKFTFDTGSNPQPGQTWNINQNIQLAGHTLTVTSISLGSQNSYSFNFKVGTEVYGADVEIDGTSPNGGGGSGTNNGVFERSIAYAQVPTGKLTATVFNLILVGKSMTWQTQWSPSVPRTDLPVNPTPQPGLCLTVDSLAQLQPAPASLTAGKALLYEPIEGTDKYGLVLYGLDGSGKQILAADASWGAFSPDGTQMAYPAADGIHVIDVTSKTEKILAGKSGFNLHWSPDGKKIAYVGMGDNIIDSVFVVNVDGSGFQQVSDLSYESVIGWSLDSAKLYFVIPYTGGAAWKVYSYDLSNSSLQELFTIENGTPKFLNPQLSPDGKWIAYRGRDNSSLYLVHPDGSDMHLVVDNAGVVGIAWSRSGWLGVSRYLENSDEKSVILLNPDDCQTYLLPDLHGELEGLFLP